MSELATVINSLTMISSNGINEKPASNPNGIDFHLNSKESHIKQEKMPPTPKSAAINKQQAQRLADFYDHKTIFITGVTGFIGKVCLIKLMSSLGNYKKIYVMLRSKKGLTAKQRVDKLLSEEPFKPAPDRGQPALDIDRSKIEAVDGDMSLENLGLTEEMRREICNSVEIVFNIAASVQFDAPLKDNLRNNYIGTKNLLQLAVSFERLVSIVHVSTFFSNMHKSHIEEKVLPMDRDCEKMAELISWMPDSICNKIEPYILENRPNTYVFTKAMSENLVQRYQGRLPLAIVRPSIVTPSKSEPFPGWVDNINGPMGLGVLGSLGILRNIDWNYWGVADWIPVDVVVNSMLAVAERTARLYPNEIKVYNASSSSLNPITWGKGFEVLREETIKAPPYKMLRMPIEVPKHRRANKVGFALTKASEILFAYFVDFILMLCGQKQILTKLTARLHHGYKLLLPFTTSEFTCSNENIEAAFRELQPEDKKEFDFDIRSMDWLAMCKDSYYGARKKLLKEDLSNLPSALFKMKVMKLIGLAFSWMFYAFVAWRVFSMFQAI